MLLFFHQLMRIKRKFLASVRCSIRIPYLLLNPLYTCFFGFIVDKNILEFRNMRFLFPCLRCLNPKLNYFVLHASYGDKWLILSMLGAHFKFYPQSRVLAYLEDRPLIDLFFESSEISSRFIFINRLSLIKLNSFFGPNSRLTQPLMDRSEISSGLPVTPYVLNSGLPAGTLRPLHIIHYPYFEDLMYSHGVSYGSLLKTIMYLPFTAMPVKPVFYNTVHLQRLADLFEFDNLKYSQYEKKDNSVLINPVNFSHLALNESQLEVLILCIIANGFTVIVNYAQAVCPDSISKLAKENQLIKIVSIPSDLMPLASCIVSAVIGVLGGAMSVSALFGCAHILSLQTLAVYLGLDDAYFLPYWYGEKIWKWNHQDWPCMYEGRIIENKWIGDPFNLSNCELKLIVESFLSRVSSSQTYSGALSLKQHYGLL